MKIANASFAPKQIAMISYWTSPVTPIVNALFDEGMIIRHTSQVDAAYLASCQTSGRVGSMPSASVWMIPSTEQEEA